MDYNENEEETIIKGKIIAITTLSVICVVIIFIVIGVISIKSIFNEMTKHKYYVLEINNNNKDEIIFLLENEEKEYCESIYKIEYEQLFPNDKSAKIYCKDEENIEFVIPDSNDSELANYIFENGVAGKR